MKKLLYLFIFVFLGSCTSNTIYKKPENLIPKDTMVALLSDMYVALAAKNIKNKNLEQQVNYLPLVYAKYKIDSTRFNESSIYYTSVIEQYNEILVEVKEKIDKEHKKYSGVLKIQDSIKNEENIKAKEAKIKRLNSEGKFKTKLEIDTLLLQDKNGALNNQLKKR